ncbi:hypothetical protein MML48_6g00016803 [Holotrichia oblita]|uniref:Uncharacterized protein n=1 Tax=Holotrichia oblita TaxID=644536 RepID=A0ACB9SYQ1_HOLOL|nr:hypothetical protein MML48_6g00016803 [Holotrichia oblita]
MREQSYDAFQQITEEDWEDIAFSKIDMEEGYVWEGSSALPCNQSNGQVGKAMNWYGGKNSLERQQQRPGEVAVMVYTLPIIQNKTNMKVNQDHWTTFLDFCEMHPELITNKFSGSMGRAHSTTLWNRIVNQLNGLGHSTKTIEEWRKAVTDWKCKVKAKAAKLRNQQINTGGGEAKYPPLTNPEERFLKIIGCKGINGDAVPELGISVPVINKATEMQLFSDASTQGIREDINSCTTKKGRGSDFAENVAVEVEVDASPLPSTSKDVLQMDHAYSINTPQHQTQSSALNRNTEH